MRFLHLVLTGKGHRISIPFGENNHAHGTYRVLEVVRLGKICNMSQSSGLVLPLTHIGTIISLICVPFRLGIKIHCEKPLHPVGPRRRLHLETIEDPQIDSVMTTLEKS